MIDFLLDIARFFAGNYQKIFLRLLLIYILLYPIVVVYSILGTGGHKRYLDKKELGAGPLVRERQQRDKYFGEDSFSWRHALGSWGIFESPIRFEKTIMEEEKREKLAVREDQIQEVLLAAREISDDLIVDLDENPFLYVTIINDAFEEMTMNWLCNVQPFETILDRTLIIAGSKRVCVRIEKEHNEVSCVSIPLPSSFNRHFEERPVHRREFTAYGMLILNRLAAMGLNFLYFDTDSLWLRDPSNLFSNATEQRRADIISGATSDDEEYSSDPLLILSNNQTTSFLAEAKRLLVKDGEMELKEVINKLCRGRFKGVKCDRFNWSDVTDGEWFEYGPRQRSRYSPYIVSNNMQREIIDKTARQEINKMWLLKKGKCDDGLRKKFFIEYGDKEIAKKLNYTKEMEITGMWSRTMKFIDELWSDLQWNFGGALRFLHIII